MKSRILSIATLLVLLTIIASQPVSAQSPTAPSPTPVAPTKAAVHATTRDAAPKFTSSEADLLQQPSEKKIPAAQAPGQALAPAPERTLTAAEIEELKDGK